jgi:hypothetical protein
MPDPIRFDVSNPQTPTAGPVIYISDDAVKWGRLDITLTNPATDNSDVKLEPGGVLQIYLEMLTPADIKNITLPAGSAWAGGPDPTNRHLELHPKQTIKIPAQSAITIELQNVLGHAPRQGKFRFYDQALGIRNAVVQGFVQRPPAEGASQWGLACVLDPRVEYQNQGNTIYVTGAGKPDIANALLVHLYRSVDGTLPSAGTPQLSFSFLTGDGELSLCSEDRLKKVTASIQDQMPPGRWKSPAADTQGQDTVWTVTPAGGDGDLFPEDGLLTLRFDTIVTDLPPGDSILFIHYTGITGYDDGHIQVSLSKTAPVPYLRSFVAYYDKAPVGTGATVHYGTLELGWDVFAAEAAVLRDVIAGPSSDQVLKATDTGTVQAVTANVSYQIIPRTAGVDDPDDGGELDLLVAAPTAKIAASASESGATLMWSCTEGNHCTLYQDGVLLADKLPLIGQRDVSVPRTGSSTLLIKCHGISVASATVETGWLDQCKRRIADLGGVLCAPEMCNESIIKNYSAALCNCRPPYENGCPPSNPPADCCAYDVASPVPVIAYSCYCCCGTSILVAAVAMAAGSKAAHEIEVGETVRVALDGALTRWSERAVAFSAGVGADPANPMIEVDFGDSASPGTILATRNQLFLMPGGVLKRAARLVAGRDMLMRADGGTAAVIALRATQALRGVHQIATSIDPASELAGHLIVLDGIVCGDYALQVNDLDSIRPDLMAQGHATLPELGSDGYPGEAS